MKRALLRAAIICAAPLSRLRFVAVLFALIAGGGVRAESIVLPSSLASTEGSSSNAFPFDYSGLLGHANGQRYQQVYASGGFPSSPVLISQISFRPDAQFGTAFSTTLSSILIQLSTTKHPVDSLSTTFADNVGNDVTTIVDGRLSLASSFTGPANGPKDFDISINLQSPFLYDPSLGNLLLDVTNLSAEQTPLFDWAAIVGDEVSRVFTNVSDADSATANVADSGDLVTKFTFTTVPEPSTLASAALGAVAVLAARRRFNHKQTRR